jgi:hypothetical protein
MESQMLECLLESLFYLLATVGCIGIVVWLFWFLSEFLRGET